MNKNLNNISFGEDFKKIFFNSNNYQIDLVVNMMCRFSFVLQSTVCYIIVGKIII